MLHYSCLSAVKCQTVGLSKTYIHITISLKNFFCNVNLINIDQCSFKGVSLIYAVNFQLKARAFNQNFTLHFVFLCTMYKLCTNLFVYEFYWVLKLFSLFFNNILLHNAISTEGIITASVHLILIDLSLIRTEFSHSFEQTSLKKRRLIIILFFVEICSSRCTQNCTNDEFSCYLILQMVIVPHFTAPYTCCLIKHTVQKSGHLYSRPKRQKQPGIAFVHFYLCQRCLSVAKSDAHTDTHRSLTDGINCSPSPAVSYVD